MKKLTLLFLAVLISGCAQYTLVSAGSQSVAGMDVTTKTDWNKAAQKPGPNTVVWTKDGHALNEIIFVGGVEEGKSIFKQVNKELPLPTYNSEMLPNEIMELVETSLKNKFGSDVIIKTSDLRPQMIGGNQGFRFGLSFFTLQGLAKKGEVVVLPIDEKLNLVIYTAAGMHYYSAELSEIEEIFNSINI